MNYQNSDIKITLCTVLAELALLGPSTGLVQADDIEFDDDTPVQDTLEDAMVSSVSR